MRHIFVETNWLVSLAAPASDPPLAAAELLNPAKGTDLQIYLPACCIAEAKKTIRIKFQPKEADRLGTFIRWAEENNHLDHETVESARRMLTTFRARVTSDLKHLTERLRDITEAAAVKVVPLDLDVLNRSVELHFEEVELSEFDRAVLSVVLVHGQRLRDQGETDVNFCGLDSKLWPWAKKTGEARPELKKLYDAAKVWVYSDFTLTNPKRPEEF